MIGSMQNTQDKLLQSWFLKEKTKNSLNQNGIIMNHDVMLNGQADRQVSRTIERQISSKHHTEISSRISRGEIQNCVTIHI